MPRVRMYYPPGDRYQYASQGAWEREHQAEGWVLAPDDDEPAPVAEPVVDPEPAAEASEPEAEAPAPKRARAK